MAQIEIKGSTVRPGCGKTVFPFPLDPKDTPTDWLLLLLLLLQGAIMFASMISGLSWNNVSTSHWSGAALWYAGIILALTSIVLGAQQTMIMPEVVDTNTAQAFRRRLIVDENAKTAMPRRSMLFVWQAPLMCLSYSIVCFLTGLTSVVVSPLGRDPTWNDGAKVCQSRCCTRSCAGNQKLTSNQTVTLYLSVAAFAIITLVVTSLSVHRLL